MPSKPAAKFKKVTAENAVIHKISEIMTAKNAVISHYQGFQGLFP